MISRSCDSRCGPITPPRGHPTLQAPAEHRVENRPPSRAKCLGDKRGAEVTLSEDYEQRETREPTVLRRQVRSNINQRRVGGRSSRSLTSRNDLVPVMTGHHTPPNGPRSPQRQAVTPSASAALGRRSIQ